MKSRPASTSKIIGALLDSPPKIEVEDNLDFEYGHNLTPQPQAREPEPFKSTIMQPLPKTPMISAPGQTEQIYREVPAKKLAKSDEYPLVAQNAEDKNNSVSFNSFRK